LGDGPEPVATDPVGCRLLPLALTAGLVTDGDVVVRRVLAAGMRAFTVPWAGRRMVAPVAGAWAVAGRPLVAGALVTGW
jgi:hypothetical protein